MEMINLILVQNRIKGIDEIGEVLEKLLKLKWKLMFLFLHMF